MRGDRHAPSSELQRQIQPVPGRKWTPEVDKPGSGVFAGEIEDLLIEQDDAGLDRGRARADAHAQLDFTSARRLYVAEDHRPAAGILELQSESSLIGRSGRANLGQQDDDAIQRFLAIIGVAGAWRHSAPDRDQHGRHEGNV